MCVLNLDYFILNCMYTSLVSLQLATTSSTTQLKIFILTCHNLTRCTIKVKYYLYSFIPCFQKQFNSIEIDFIFLLLDWMFCKQRVNKYNQTIWYALDLVMYILCSSILFTGVMNNSYFNIQTIRIILINTFEIIHLLIKWDVNKKNKILLFSDRFTGCTCM